MLAGVAERLRFDPELLDDIKTAVSEACNNVVLHAYPGTSGVIEVAVYSDGGRLRVTVEDHGVGLPGGGAEPPDGIGLSVIRALTEVLSLGPGQDRGTCLEMEFTGQREGRPLFVDPAPAGPEHGPLCATQDEVVVSISPDSLLASVLGRMARTLAATAHFSLDRFSDVYLITDALAAHAESAAAAPRVQARLVSTDRRLELAVGPFRPGASDRLAGRGEHGPSPLVLLSDELAVEADGAGERLRVVVLDRRQ